MRVIQKRGTKGSLKWMQRAISRHPDLLQPQNLPPIHWVSPLEEDNYAEYRDGDFLWVLGLDRLSTSLRDFWPRLGPQWDALGTMDGGVVLVEAKAHLGEFRSPPSQAGTVSRVKIAAAFSVTQAALGIEATTDWTGTYYQYANRLAHLAWLVSKGINTHLVFVSFINDVEMRGPSTAVEWRDAFREADNSLGLSDDHKMAHRIHHVFPDVTLLGAD